MTEGKTQSKQELLGGQALIEGVMMKSKKSYAIAVREPNGNIFTQATTYEGWNTTYKFMGWPFIRGVFGLFEMLIIGTRALLQSSEIAIPPDDEAPTDKAGKKGVHDDHDGTEKASHQHKKVKAKSPQKGKGKKEGLSNLAMAGMVISSLVLAVFLFKFLPFALTSYLKSRGLVQGVVGFNIVDGVLRLSAFLIYVALISFLPDIKRVFGYHGAEHKVVACHEQGKPLTVENARGCSRYHPRCGTSFVVFVLVITIAIFSIVPLELGFWKVFGLRLLFLPIVAGISYEILRISAANLDKWWVSWVTIPGIWTQRLTTREPDDSMLEVSIASMNSVIEHDRKSALGSVDEASLVVS